METKIKYSGLKGLSQDEQTILKGILEKELINVQRMIKNTFSLSVYIKTAKKLAKKRFTIVLRLEAPTGVFITKNKDTEKGGDWDLTKAAHIAVDSLCSEIKHTLKTDTEIWKRGGIKRLFARMKI